jgi:hypothetical protein
VLDTVKTLIVSQYEAALSMLKACVDRCPDTAWDARVASYKFWQVVFHTLFFTDLYLGPDDESFRRQPFHLNHASFFADNDADYEPFDDRAPRPRDKASLLTYLEFCRRKVTEVMATETEDTLTGPAGFRGSRRNFSRAELHVYNIRHIQHHTAQLSLRLRLDTNGGVDWVGAGWRESVTATQQNRTGHDGDQGGHISRGN